MHIFKLSWKNCLCFFKCNKWLQVANANLIQQNNTNRLKETHHNLAAGLQGEEGFVLRLSGKNWNFKTPHVTVTFLEESRRGRQTSSQDMTESLSCFYSLWLNVRRNQPEPSADQTLDPDCWFLRVKHRHMSVSVTLNSWHQRWTGWTSIAADFRLNSAAGSSTFHIYMHSQIILNQRCE